MIKPLDYHKMQSRLFKKAKRKIFPINAMFEITYKCNLKCRHCYVVPTAINEHRESRIEHRNELNAKEIFYILDQLTEAGCLNLGFTGGEPFLRKDIFDILRYAKNKGFNIIVLTNGTLITPEKADRLKELGLNKIDISFHTTNKETFDWFTKTPGTYRRALRAVKLLRDRGIEVYLKATAMTINKDDILKIRHLGVEKFGAHFRYGPEVTPAWDGRKGNLKFRLSAKQNNQVKKAIQEDTEIEFEKLGTLEKKKRRSKKRERPRGKIEHNRLFRCGAGRTDVVISPYGQMRLCMDIPFPKYQILRGSFARGWKILNDYVKNTPPGPSYQCRDCKLTKYCNFCPARGWLECGDMSACPPYYRKMARLARKKEIENAG
ncbi:MAG: hypothetical protein A2166_03180 [Omnitrophica WOR_2 bacterium RBG_13_41_10]|nr:MAG: hypothetical protein A2166_03180 [Omnitrophica WOR_2 bacterium RBG_13_41_10]